MRERARVAEVAFAAKATQTTIVVTFRVGKDCAKTGIKPRRDESASAATATEGP